MTKPSVLAGWGLFFFLLALSIYSHIAGLGTASSVGLIAYPVHGVFNALLYGLSAWLLHRLEPYRAHIRMRNIRINRMYGGFILSASAVAAILVFLVYDLTVYPLTGTFRGIFDLYPTSGALSASRLLPALFFLAFLPAVTEEFLLRGVFFSLYESCGTSVSILLSAALTAMLMPSVRLVLPALIAGGICAVLCYLTNSVRTSALCRFLIRAYFVLMTFAAGRISSGASWNHFIALHFALLFIALYFASRTLRNLIREGLIPSFQPGSGSFGQQLSGACANTGFLLFTLLFLARMVVSLLTVILSSL